MAQRHQRREMERLLRRRERPGLTYRELSEESGIPIPTLAWWSRKLDREREDAEEAPSLVAVDVIEDEPVQSVTPEASIEILVTDRLAIVVPPAATEAQIQRVLRAVASC